MPIRNREGRGQGTEEEAEWLTDQRLDGQHEPDGGLEQPGWCEMGTHSRIFKQASGQRLYD